MDNNVVRTPRRVVRLTPQEIEFVYMLARKYPDVVRHAALEQGLWGLGDWPVYARKIEAVLVNRMRRRLRGSGVGIATHRWVGYKLTIEGYDD